MQEASRRADSKSLGTYPRALPNRHYQHHFQESQSQGNPNSCPYRKMLQRDARRFSAGHAAGTGRWGHIGQAALPCSPPWVPSWGTLCSDRRGSSRSQRGAGSAGSLQHLKPLAPAGCLPRAICPVNCCNSGQEQLQKSSLSSYKPGKGWERHKQ